MPSKSTPDDFWKRVDIRGTDECWNWIGGSINSSGYGTITYHGRHLGVHVLAYELGTGQRLLPGMDARHSCDNRICCNPAHLGPGTRKENMRDAVERRQLNQGSKHGMSKLTEADVIEIIALIALGTMTQSEIARRFSVCFQTISDISLGKSWRHVPRQVAA